MPSFPASSTALVVIDLQNGIVAMDLAPRTGAQVVDAAKGLAARFRAAGAPVVLVNVDFAADGGDALRQPVDKPSMPAGGRPPGWSTLVDGLQQATDLRTTKHNWGAFHGTDLDTQLRRRGVKTIVLAGIATNMGVESTARQAWEHGYDVVVVEDATTGRSREMHDFAVGSIFPMISRVVAAADIELA